MEPTRGTIVCGTGNDMEHRQEKEVTYVADIAQDIDDLIAIEALSLLGVLGCVVLDSPPADELSQMRVRSLINAGIRVCDSIPEASPIVFVGGGLGPVAEFLESGGRIRFLVMNGGFAGDNVVAEEQRLRKFSGRQAVRTYNFNLDADATDAVLRSDGISRIFLVGKNVCHSRLNTREGIWRNCGTFLDKFRLRPGKRLHDLLAACEGLSLVGLSDEPLSCEYRMLYPCNNGLSGDRTEWGCSESPTGYRQAMVAVGWARKDARHDLC